MQKNCLYCGNIIEEVKRSTKKYCNDNCKQLAYYKRKGISLSGNSSDNSSAAIISNDIIVKEPAIVKQEDFTVNDKNKPEIEIITNADSNQNEKEITAQEITSKEMIVKQEIRETTKEAAKEEPKKDIALEKVKFPAKERSYHQVESQFVNRIADYVNDSGESDVFLCPESYWHPGDMPYVKWVTVRVRCLLESVIKISNCPHIDRQTLIELADAFNRLICCEFFKLMPRNYPCTKWMTELNEKIQAFAIANQDYETIRFRLSPQRKAELIAKRFVIGNFADKVKFSQLSFETALDKKF